MPTIDRFAAVHTLVNTSQWIPRGSDMWRVLLRDPSIVEVTRWREGIRGFGLPIGDAFLLFDPLAGIFESLDESGRPVPLRDAENRAFPPAVDRWLRDGWVDALHSAGEGELERAAVAAGLAWLEAEPHRGLSVWVNHSLTRTPSNVEPDALGALRVLVANLARSVLPNHDSPWPLPPSQRLQIYALAAGVVSGVGIAAAGLVRRARRTAWLAAGMLGAASCLAALAATPLEYAQGDNPGSRFYNVDRVQDAGFRFFWMLGGRGGFEGTRGHGLSLPEKVWHGRRSVLRVARLDDGSRVLTFPRTAVGGGGYRSLDMLSDENLDALVEDGGTAILQTHWVSGGYEVFSAEALAGLERLSARYRAGQVWVAPTSRILRHDLVRTFLRFDAVSRGGRLVIDVLAVEPPAGEAFVPSLSMLEGISFRVDGDAHLDLLLAGEPVERSGFEVIDDSGARVLRIGAAN